MNYATSAEIGDTMTVKEFGIRKEKAIAKTFYQDYEKVRYALFTHLLEQNSQLSKRVLFDKTQKILGRLLFIRFIEDYKLMPRNALRNIVQAAQHSDMGGMKSWEKLSGLFRSIAKENSGIFNSKLLHKDDVLDQLVVTDRIFPVFEAIIDYDFASDLDVSVLGYVFEQSINGMEDMTDKHDSLQQGKRKQDGIFYTSPDITRLLLQETLLNWIDDRKRELREIYSGDDIECHQEWRRHLKSVKILDPAAGSGAFLTMAYEMLQTEWTKMNDTTKGNIGTDNLFGVELNEESLDLAKLSFWLKSAAGQDNWPTLDKNLKTGNAIIDHLDISERAFDWHQEFPEVMADGGFDIIIGNPPYIFARNEGFTNQEKSYFRRHYKLTEYQINTYLLFIERSYHLLKEGGWLGFIVPNNFLTIESCKKMRQFLLEQTGNLKIINIPHRMFEQADVDTCLLIFQKTGPTTVKLGEYVNESVDIVAEVHPAELLNEQSIINISLMKNKKVADVLKKIETGNPDLGSVATVKSGLVAYEVGRGNPEQTKDMKENRIYHSDFQVDDTYWMYLEGRDVCRYHIDWGGSWLRYGPHLAAKRSEDIFSSPRILVRQIPANSKYAIHAVYTEKDMLNDRNSNNIIDFQKDPLFLLGVINSKIITFWFIHKFDKFQRKTFPQFKVKDLKMFPVPDVSEQEEKRISEAVSQMLDLQHDKSKVLNAMENVMLHALKIDKLPVRFQSFYEWDADEWLEQIGKLRRLSLTKKNDWLEYFWNRKQVFVQLAEKEEELNDQIDQYTAAAFGLNENEVHLIDDNLEEFPG
ncbi:TaqI-like C-terminal specificity domain-containing protein [Lentibacillus sp. CBA3610]|uniref:Eco57I restriction-modification methylase domain-containing protein n=1 Tax=Lentibacillus sp. CBA3610 TaxID=2518176 RepID=UPI0015958A24|nr:TaqI-like C-terminal specificity domain-containing protein [Lentibacillus sp. CBA3610]QKY69850.1 hypothetical protein Len3610_09815 [Lentibacillus sp. CBA3610]